MKDPIEAALKVARQNVEETANKLADLQGEMNTLVAKKRAIEAELLEQNQMIDAKLAHIRAAHDTNMFSLGHLQALKQLQGDFVIQAETAQG